MDRLRHSPRNLVFLLLLIAGVLYQGWNLLNDVRGELLDVRGTIGQDGLWRSAYYFQGERFADFIKFIHANTPQDARIVLPPLDSGPRALGTTPAMQFFLAPRQVINCPNLDCLKSISPQNTYLVIVDPAQAASLDSSLRQLLMFDRDWGLILPENPQSGNPDPMPGFASFIEILQAAFWPIMWLACLTVSGLLIIQRLAPEMASLFKASLGYGLALGFFTFLACGASLVGLALDRNLLLGLTALLLLTSLGFFYFLRKPRRIEGHPSLAESSPRFSFDLWLVPLLLLGGIAALISLGKGFHTTDEIMLWGAKGYGIAAADTVRTVTDWGTNTVPYPLHIPLLIANFRILFSDVLPASKLVFAGYYLGLILVAYYTLIRIKISGIVAGLGTLFLATVPLVFRHATIAYANLTLSYTLLAAVAMLALSFEAEAPPQSGRLALLSGLFFALAGWARPEGLILSWLLIGLVLGLASFRKWEPFSLRKALLLVSPLALYTLFWWLLKTLIYSRPAGWPNLTTAAMAQAIKGNFHPNEAFYLIQALVVRLASVDTWGMLGFGLALLLIVALFLPARRYKASAVLIGSGLLYAVMILGIYYLTSFDSTHDLSWWVSTGLDRMLFPALMLLWLGSLSVGQSFNQPK